MGRRLNRRGMGSRLGPVCWLLDSAEIHPDFWSGGYCLTLPPELTTFNFGEITPENLPVTPKNLAVTLKVPRFTPQKNAARLKNRSLTRERFAPGLSSSLAGESTVVLVLSGIVAGPSWGGLAKVDILATPRGVELEIPSPRRGWKWTFPHLGRGGTPDFFTPRWVEIHRHSPPEYSVLAPIHPPALTSFGL